MFQLIAKSGRMFSKLTKIKRATVISNNWPLSTRPSRPIKINFWIRLNHSRNCIWILRLIPKIGNWPEETWQRLNQSTPRCLKPTISWPRPVLPKGIRTLRELAEETKDPGPSWVDPIAHLTRRERNSHLKLATGLVLWQRLIANLIWRICNQEIKLRAPTLLLLTLQIVGRWPILRMLIPKHRPNWVVEVTLVEIISTQ